MDPYNTGFPLGTNPEVIMKAATASTPVVIQWFAQLRSGLARAWEIHVRTCELIAEAHRRM